MRKITKTGPPPELTHLRHRNPGTRYNNLSSVERRVIRKACLDEQKGLCAFCCCSITVDNAHNDHLLGQARHPQRSLDWDNIVAGCTAAEHCGNYQGQRDIPLTPLMPECETELQFYVSGTVKSLTDRAKRTVEILNLDSSILRLKRKHALDALLYSSEFYPAEDIPVWDEELIQAFIAECGKEMDGILSPYAPVLANIVRQFLPLPPSE
jgi:uncharacterized protein (TIGR02646 family)